MLTRRRILGASIVTGMAGLLPPFASWAQTVSKPARLLVGFPAGGSIDAVARLVVEHMKGYAPSMIVDNRPGAGGRMALDALKGSEPDGSVALITPGDQLTLFPHIYSRLGYKPLEDFAPVSTVCSVQFLLTIGPMVPQQVTALADFIAWCRQIPSWRPTAPRVRALGHTFSVRRCSVPQNSSLCICPTRAIRPPSRTCSGVTSPPISVRLATRFPMFSRALFGLSRRPRRAVALRSQAFPHSGRPDTPQWKLSNGSASSCRRGLQLPWSRRSTARYEGRSRLPRSRPG